MRCFGVAAALVALLSPVLADHIEKHGKTFQPDHVLRVTFNQNYSIACDTRPTVLVNGSSPGPTIHLKPGRVSWVRVYNDIPDRNFTMHWHGLSQRTAIFSDGTPAASQWPIPPMHYFDYEIRPEIEDAGTYFYHSHVGFQAVSAHGGLIVDDDADPPYDYDRDEVVLMTDHYHATDDTIEHGLTAVPFQWSGETNAVLVNGVGVSNYGNASRKACKLPTIDVEPGLTYRLRFIGGTAISLVQFGFAEHGSLKVIAADGHYTKPYPVSYVQVASGQRLDVLFKAKRKDEVKIRSDYLFQFETKERPTVYRGYGVLRYNCKRALNITAPSSPLISFPNKTYDYLEYALEPVKPNGFPTAKEVTRRIIIDARQQLTASIIWRFNGNQWNESTTASVYPGTAPYLVQIYKDGEKAMPNYTAAMSNGGWDPATYAFPAKIGEVLEIIWQNTGSLVRNNGGVDYHPMHAHGRHYWDIGSGNGTYDPEANEKRLKKYKPLLRDTTMLYRYATSTTAGDNAGWRGWRLRVDAPGVWMMHCHILQHMIMGMQTVWVFGDADQIRSVSPITAQGYLEYGGTAYGNPFFAARAGHTLGDSD